MSGGTAQKQVRPRVWQQKPSRKVRQTQLFSYTSTNLDSRKESSEEYLSSVLHRTQQMKQRGSNTTPEGAFEDQRASNLMLIPLVWVSITGMDTSCLELSCSPWNIWCFRENQFHQIPFKASTVSFSFLKHHKNISVHSSCKLHAAKPLGTRGGFTPSSLWGDSAHHCTIMPTPHPHPPARSHRMEDMQWLQQLRGEQKHETLATSDSCPCFVPQVGRSLSTQKMLQGQTATGDLSRLPASCTSDTQAHLLQPDEAQAADVRAALTPML